MPKAEKGVGFHRYNRGSVERAFVTHGFVMGQNVIRQGAGYSVSTSVGWIDLKTLREAYQFVVALAEKGRRVERAAADKQATAERLMVEYDRRYPHATEFQRGDYQHEVRKILDALENEGAQIHLRSA